MLHVATQRALLGYRSRGRTSMPAPFIDLESEVGLYETLPVPDPPTGGSGTPNYVTGGSYQSGSVNTLRVYSYYTNGPYTVFSTGYLEIVNDAITLDDASIDWAWTAPGGNPVTGYRVILGNAQHNFNVYQDVNPIAFTDNGGGYGAGNTVTPNTGDFSIDGLDQCNVSKWLDQSGNGHDLLQPTAASQPELFANQLNGYPAVRLSAGNSIGSLALYAAKDVLTIVAVVKLITANGTVTIAQLDGLAAAKIYKAGNVWNYGVGAQLSGGATSTNAAVLAVVINGASSSIVLNGVTVASGTAAAAAATGLLLNGDADLIALKAYAAGLSTAQLAAVRAEFKAKYPALP